MALNCKHEISDKNLANCSPYLIPLQAINNLETERSYKTTVNFENLKFSKKYVERFQIIRLFVYKTAKQERLDTY